MKINSKIIPAAMLILLAASCNNKDDRMLTVINEDGSCAREYTFHSTRQLLAIPLEEDYDSIVDKSWERSWSVGEHEQRHLVPLKDAEWDSIQATAPNDTLDNMLMVHVKKEYESVNDMSAQLYAPENSHLVKVEGIKAKSTLEKSFKWFYTDYTFSETFVYDGAPVFPVPLTRFLSADTAAYWFTGQPDLTRNLSGAELKEMLDDIDAKVCQWINANYFYETCNTIIAHYDSIQNPPVSKERFISMRDSLVMLPCVLNANDGFVWKNGVNVLDSLFLSESYSSFLKLYEEEPEGYAQLFSFSTTYDLKMPGTIVDAGMGEYDGEVIHYRLSGERLIPDTFTITATSRVTNIWAFIVTLLIIVLAIGSFLYQRKR
ncbi:MAG: hypothetical protein K6D91_02430 [Prevotella sp.]|nr:hypothetical protein [Prevotella sp.]